MTTLKESITRELLDGANNPDGLETVFHKHGGSKGPLYSALAEATSKLKGKLEKIGSEAAELERTRASLRDEVASLDEKKSQLEASLPALDLKLRQKEDRLKELQGLLDKAHELQKSGFGQQELSRLAETLAQVAASQGAQPGQGIREFFKVLSQYERVTSLDLEAKSAEVKAKKARAEAERWESEARAKEARSKVRAIAVDLMEKWVSQGVKEQDPPQWDKALKKFNVPLDSLVGALEEYGSLDLLVRGLQGATKELLAQQSTLKSRIDALTKEHDALHGAIQEVQDEGIGAVEETKKEVVLRIATAGAQATRQIAEVVEQLKKQALGLKQLTLDYGEVRAEAAELSDFIEVARALRTGDAKVWQSLSRETVKQLVSGVCIWTQGGDRDIEVIVPQVVHRSTLVSSYAKLRLSGILIWALSGLTSEGERKLLQSGY